MRKARQKGLDPTEVQNEVSTDTNHKKLEEAEPEVNIRLLW